jgi:signal transduction histidine kinase
MKNQETEIELLKAKHRLELSRISHEIRNPVTLINSSIQIIETEHPEVSDFTFWPELKSDLEFLRKLLDEFSGYNNSDRLVLERLHPSDYFSEIAFNAPALTDNSNIQFICEIDRNLPDILMDATKIRQAVTNLLRNAFESGASRVSFSCSREGEQLSIRIADNGSGIPDQAKETLFTPFVTHKKNGTGLGLSIVKRIVEAHKGHITYTSGNSGTCFSLLLPINTAANTKPAIIPPKCAI